MLTSRTLSYFEDIKTITETFEIFNPTSYIFLVSMTEDKFHEHPLGLTGDLHCIEYSVMKKISLEMKTFEEKTSPRNLSAISFEPMYLTPNSFEALQFAISPIPRNRFVSYIKPTVNTWDEVV